ncbi:MAG: hypothetical protein WAV72_30660 [Bradyrhizobium sp.]
MSDDERTGDCRTGGGGDDIRRRARERLQTEGAEVGVRVLIELAEDKSQKGSTRGAAAKALVQSSGSTLPMLSQEDLADMPAEQIRALLGEAQRALEARLNKLKTIEHTPRVPELPRPARLEAVKDTDQAGGLFD